MDGVVLVLEEVGAVFVRELVLVAGGCLCHVFRVRIPRKDWVIEEWGLGPAGYTGPWARPIAGGMTANWPAGHSPARVLHRHGRDRPGPRGEMFGPRG